MRHGENTLALSLLIILGLPALFALVGCLVVKFWRDPVIGRLHACPHCQHRGRISSFGSFRCVSCQNVFFLNESGQVVSSLRQAVTRPLVWWLIVGVLLVLADFYLGHHWWNSAFYWISIWPQMLTIMSRKKFPID